MLSDTQCKLQQPLFSLKLQRVFFFIEKDCELLHSFASIPSMTITVTLAVRCNSIHVMPVIFDVPLMSVSLRLNHTFLSIDISGLTVFVSRVMISLLLNSWTVSMNT